MPFFDILRFQGDHHCACAQTWCHFSFFSKSFQTIKKIKALRPKMTKIASRGSCLNTLYGLWPAMGDICLGIITRAFEMCVCVYACARARVCVSQ